MRRAASHTTRHTPPAMRNGGHELHRHTAVGVVHPYLAQLQAREEAGGSGSAWRAPRLHDVQLLQRQRVLRIAYVSYQVEHFNCNAQDSDMRSFFTCARM